MDWPLTEVYTFGIPSGKLYQKHLRKWQFPVFKGKPPFSLPGQFGECSEPSKKVEQKRNGASLQNTWIPQLNQTKGVSLKFTNAEIQLRINTSPSPAAQSWNLYSRHPKCAQCKVLCIQYINFRKHHQLRGVRCGVELHIEQFWEKQSWT